MRVMDSGYTTDARSSKDFRDMSEQNDSGLVLLAYIPSSVQ